MVSGALPVLMGVGIVFVVRAIARRTRPGFFSPGWVGSWPVLGAGAAAGGLGVWGSIWCYHNHVCIGGHMDHPPYETFHYQWEAAWILCLLLSGVLAFASRSFYALLFVAVFAYLVIYRFGFESLGGVYTYPL